jgi:histidinol-phosphate aminotransferase
LFPEIAHRYSETRLLPQRDFSFDLADLRIPEKTTLAVIVNPTNANGGTFDMGPLPNLLRDFPETRFLVDEAFIGLAGPSVAHLVPAHRNLTRARRSDRFNSRRSGAE